MNIIRARETKGNVETAEKIERILKAMKDKKAFDIVTIDVNGRTSVCDFFVVASANNVIQTHAVAEKVEEDLAKEGESALRVEGGRGAKWIAMDYSDVIVHVFEKETRAEYNIERLWNTGDNLRPAE